MISTGHYGWSRGYLVGRAELGQVNATRRGAQSSLSKRSARAGERDARGRSKLTLEALRPGGQVNATRGGAQSSLSKRSARAGERDARGRSKLTLEALRPGR
jgi:hypothetical protein